MPTGLASTPPPPIPGALEDDPLTSPSFSLKAVPATDSRSYRNARQSARAASPGSGHGSGPLPSDPRAGTGAGHLGGGPDSASYPAADYASPSYAYPAEPAPAAPAEWYSSPPEAQAPTPAYGNPYSYPGPSTAGSPAGHPGDTGYSGSYLADPLRVYSPPLYEPPGAAAYPDPASAPYQALPAQGMAAQPMEPTGHMPYPEAYPEHPYGPGQGQLDPPQYPDGYGGAGYTPSYESGYGGDPYAGGGYGTYPSQG